MRNPRESTRIWRLRPLTFLPPSVPRSLPPSAVLTDWLSIAAALGVSARPAWTRARGRRTSRIDPLPGAVRAPFPEVVIHAIPGREVVRQGAPGAAFPGMIEQRVDDFPKVYLTRPTGSGAAPGPGE